MKKILFLIILGLSITLSGCENIDDSPNDDEDIIEDDNIDDDNDDIMPINKIINYYYLDNSDLEIILSDESVINSIETDIDSFTDTVYEYNNGIFTLYKSFLLSLEEGTYVININTDNNLYKINVKIIDNRIPVLLSNNVITYSEEINLNLLFELYGGSVVKLNGNNILDSDYVIDGSTVNINNSFINNIISNDPLRETIILSYYLENKGFITIGYIFIEVN